MSARWILLRGLTREARHWGDFPARLRAAFTDATIHTPDLPGNGRLHAQASPASVGAMTEHCRAQLRAAGIAPERVRRWFLRHYGMTFHAFQRMARVNQAVRELQSGRKASAVSGQGMGGVAP